MIRVFNRILTLLIGLALIGGGTLVIIEGIWTWTNSGFVWIPGNQWLTSFKTTAWSAPIVIGVSVAVAVGGFVLFVLESRPQRKRVATFETANAGDWLLLRSSTEGHLRRRLAVQVPVSPIKARLNPKARRWTLTVKARAASSTRPALESAGRDELASLHAPAASRVRVKTTGASKS